MIRQILAAAALACAAGAGSAATVTQTQGFTGPGQFLFNGFDATLGTLTGVTAELNAVYTLLPGSIWGDPEPRGDNFLFVTTIGLFSTIVLNGSLVLTVSPFGSLALCESATPESCRASYEGASESVSGTDTATGNLWLFETDFSMLVGILTFADPDIGRPLGGPSEEWTGEGTVKLTYTYEPTVIPLPAAFPLLLAGLGALGALGLRRRPIA